MAVVLLSPFLPYIYHIILPSPHYHSVDSGTAGVAGPEETDLKAILSDPYPASSARVVAALSRRCRELQVCIGRAQAPGVGVRAGATLP